MKKLLSLIIVFIGLAFLAACQQQEVKGNTYYFDRDIRPVTKITVWIDDTDLKLAAKLKAGFEATHPDIIVDIKHQSTVDAEANLLMLGQAGMGADIFQFPHDHLATALQSDLLWALPTDFADSMKERMLPTAMDIASACYDNTTGSFECANGVTKEVFGAPLSIETVALFYNKDLIKAETGSETPAATFDEIIAKSQTYNNPATNKYWFLTNFDDSYFMTFAYTAFGFQPFGENGNDKNTPNISSDAVISGLTWVRDNMKPLYAEGSTADGVRALTSQFEAGTLPYIITGPWMIETYKNKGINFGVTTLPTINDNGVQVTPKSFAGAQMAGIYKYSRNKDAALEFLKYMVSNEGLKYQYEVKGKLPALKDELLTQIPGVTEDQYLAGIRAQLPNTIPMPTLPAVASYWEPVRQMMLNVWNNGQDPAAAAAAAETAYFNDLNQ